MLNQLFRKLAHLVLMAGLACGTLVIAANKASAATKVLAGTHSFGQVAAACGGGGGQFNVSASGGYGCQTASGPITGIQCNAKGQCAVFCKGACPAVSKGLNGVLRPPASAGTASAAGGTGTKNKPPLHNVNQPVVVQHSGGTRSGGSKH
jgi:hypothetical protein